MNTTNNMPKTRQLWNNPQVFLTNADLVIDSKFYPLAQTLGAYVEVVPAPKTAQNEAAPKKGVTFTTVLKVIGFALIIIFVLALSIFLDSSSFTWGGSNTMYQLVLNSEYGQATVIKSSNRKKLNKIAQEVNQQLMVYGRRPVTQGFEAAMAAR